MFFTGDPWTCMATTGSWCGATAASAWAKALRTKAGRFFPCLHSMEKSGVSTSDMSPRLRPETGLRSPAKIAAMSRSICFQWSDLATLLLLLLTLQLRAQPVAAGHVVLGGLVPAVLDLVQGLGCVHQT